jgi:DNA helicase HerA-like ATPase
MLFIQLWRLRVLGLLIAAGDQLKSSLDPTRGREGYGKNAFDIDLPESTRSSLEPPRHDLRHR